MGGVRNLAWGPMALLGAAPLARRLNRRRATILAYHGVTSRRLEPSPWTLIPLEAFERQMDHVSRVFRVLPLARLARGLAGTEELPPNAAALTFDDGYANNLHLVLPVLERHGLPATFFVTAGHVGSPELLPLDEAWLLAGRGGDTAGYRALERELKAIPAAGQRRRLRELGAGPSAPSAGDGLRGEFRILDEGELRLLAASPLADIGAHTMGHEILANLPLEAARKEIRDSRSRLRELTGAEVRFFAYPNGRPGDWLEAHERILKEEGFAGAVTTVPALNSPGADPFRLGRISVGPELAADQAHFDLKTSGLAFLLGRAGR